MLIGYAPRHSAVARHQAIVWANTEERLAVARRLYAWRMSEVMPHRELKALRGIEGVRVRALYLA